MRVPISWLRDFVDIPADVSVEYLAERLTLAGLEVKGIEYRGIPQSAERFGVPPSDHLVWNREKILLGYIYEVTAHPNADKLVLAEVDYGGPQRETVVTGAPNLFEYKGQGQLNPPLLTPFALEGAEVIDGHGDGVQRMILKEKALRGIPNRCMVCSEMELGISSEHEGIMLLEYATYSRFAPGTPFVDVMGDAILEIDILPNIARTMSMLGVAREVAALLDLPLHEPDYTLPPAKGEPVEKAIGIEITHPELNPRFTAALLRNITIKPSPAWMQHRLKLVGQRPINNVVDVSNYVMFELGQPTHAFDYDILARRAKGKRPTIITRLPENGEELTTLDGKTHKLAPHNLLVADTAGSLSLAGVMGGLESEVQDVDPEKGFPGSQNILFEAASWNFINIRKTQSNLKVYSEAGARFSRGVHPAMAMRGLIRGIQLMVEVAGAELAPGIVDNYPAPPEVVTVELPMADVERLLGFDVPIAEAASLLRRLQFKVEQKADTLIVTVPDHRMDIATGVIGRSDLTEEIARIFGYDRIPNTIMFDELPPQRGNPALDLEERVRDLLAQAGLREVINYRFTTPEHESLLTPDGADQSWPKRDYVEIANPISMERTALRQTLLTGLLDNAITNIHHHPRQQLFEIGPVFYAKPNDLPDEFRHLGLLMAGPRDVAGWMGGASLDNVDFYDLKGVLESLLTNLKIPARSISYAATEHASFHPGRTALLKINGKEVGVIGEVHPLVREAFGLGMDLKKPVLAAELDLDVLLSFVPADHTVQALPQLPPAYRDIAVVVSESTQAADLENIIWQSGGKVLKEVKLFDVYRGQPIPEGQKSLAYSLTFQTDSQTLTDKAVNGIQQQIIRALEKAGAKLRA